MSASGPSGPVVEKCSFRNMVSIIRESNSLDPDQDRHFVKFIFFKMFFQKHYQRVKLFGSRSGHFNLFVYLYLD